MLYPCGYKYIRLVRLITFAFEIISVIADHDSARHVSRRVDVRRRAQCERCFSQIRLSKTLVVNDVLLCLVKCCRRATHGIRVCRRSDDGANIAKCIPFRFSFRSTQHTPRQALYNCACIKYYTACNST